MKFAIKSKKLGRLEVEAERVITFPEGILGFPGIKRYALVENDKGHPFLWLQAVEDPELAFVVTDPLIFQPDYQPPFPADELHGLEIHGYKYMITFAIVTVPHEDPLKLTANFLAPLVINSKTHRAKQIVLYGSDYSLREPLIKAPVQSLP